MLTSSLGSNSGTREAAGSCPRCPPGTPASTSDCMSKAPELRHPSPPLAPPGWWKTLPDERNRWWGRGEGSTAAVWGLGYTLPTDVSPSPSHLTLSTPVKFKTILIKAPQPKLAGASGSQKGKG